MFKCRNNEGTNPNRLFWSQKIELNLDLPPWVAIPWKMRSVFSFKKSNLKFISMSKNCAKFVLNVPTDFRICAFSPSRLHQSKFKVVSHPKRNFGYWKWCSIYAKCANIIQNSYLFPQIAISEWICGGISRLYFCVTRFWSKCASCPESLLEW